MRNYLFKSNNSDGEEIIIRVEHYSQFEAREKAQEICYKMGLCFLGSV